MLEHVTSPQVPWSVIWFYMFSFHSIGYYDFVKNCMISYDIICRYMMKACWVGPQSSEATSRPRPPQHCLDQEAKLLLHVVHLLVRRLRDDQASRSRGDGRSLFQYVPLRSLKVCMRDCVGAFWNQLECDELYPLEDTTLHEGSQGHWNTALEAYCILLYPTAI